MRIASLPLGTVVSLSLSLCGLPLAAAEVDGAYRPVELGPHHRVWASVTWETNRMNRRVAHTNAFTEIATGLHFWDGQQWQESREIIEAYPGGAIARQGAHKVIFADDFASVVLIDLEMPDGQRLQSRVVGLAYLDTASGKSVWIAEATNSTGLLLPPNQVLYPNAFSGLKADARYTYTKAGFEQDIILREQPPLPDAFGLDPRFVRLQVVTEFLSPPAPVVKVIAQAAGTDGGVPFEDHSLDFGAMRTFSGKGFLIGKAGTADGEAVRVFKRWQPWQGRQFLVEEVSLLGVAAQLDTLPVRQAAVRGTIRQASVERQLPARTEMRKGQRQPMELAKLDAPRPGFVLDYDLQSTETDFTFQADTTYYVSGAANLSGLTTLEGGAVTKFTNSASAAINILGTVDCRTGPYRPALFTSKDDDTAGTVLPGSSGSPAGYYGGGLKFSTSSNQVHDVRFAWLGNGVRLVLNSGGWLGLTNAQFVRCQYPLYAEQTMCFLFCGATIHLDNALIYRADTVFSGDIGILRARHVTVNQAGQLGNDYGNDCSLNLTNSLLVAATNWGNMFYYTNSTVFLSTDPGGIFQTVGAGAHYLATNSPYRNVGTTNVPPALLAALARRTTYPPVVISNEVLSANLELYPQAQRDSDLPDLGYHYDPLDYAFGTVRITNATISAWPETAVGIWSGGYGYGLALLTGSKFAGNGTPTAPVWIARYDTVQEQANLNWTNASTGIDCSFVGNWYGGDASRIECRFTKFSALADRGAHFSDRLYSTPNWFSDCEFHGGSFGIGGSTLVATNCLFERVATYLSDDGWASDMRVRNCTFYGGSLGITHWDSGNFLFRDNLFDRTSMYQDGGVDSDYNGFGLGSTMFDPPGAHDLLTNLTFVAGPLGYYYQPTNSRFVQIGSTTADQVALYHFTVTTNLVNGWEIRETNSVLDLGYHYVAVDSNGDPIDSDGGGVPDWQEDTNGNGDIDGETDPGDGDDDFNYQLVPGYLRCEYRVDPWGVDAKDPWTQQQRPRLFWIVTSPKRAAKQVAYQVLVASTPENLSANYGDMWNSGKVYSDRTIHVEYDPTQGKPLQSGQRLWWKVRSWDRHSGYSKWSTNAFFQMGLLNTNDWDGAYWISLGADKYQSAKPCPMFRSQPFVLTNEIKNATAYVSAKGVYELWINGQRVGPHILAPEWTDYNQRIQYQTYDVSALLNHGTDTSSNVIGAFVGEGWCYGPTDWNNYYGLPNPQFLLRLNITNTDETWTNYYTGSSWLCSTNGAIQKAHIYHGEQFDARQEGATTDWTSAAYTPLYFTNSLTFSNVVASKLASQPNEPIQIVERLKPIGMWTNVNELAQAVVIYDMGQNMVGWCDLKVSTSTGQDLVIGTNATTLSGSNVFVRHAEILKLDSNNNGANGPSTANIERKNLTGAAQTETYILNSDSTQLLHPHFTYHGFRYVEIAGPQVVLDGLDMNSITGCVIHSAVPVTGSFWCSDTNASTYVTNLVSKLMTNAFWGMRGNLQGVFTACTQRDEREGYLFDEHIFSQSASYFAGMGAFMTKWLRDIDEAQLLRTDLGFTDIAPYDDNPILGVGHWGLYYSDPGAQAGGVVLPWRLYENYADTRVLAEHYRAITNQIAYLTNLCGAVSGSWSTTAWNQNYYGGNSLVNDWLAGDYVYFASPSGAHPYGWGSGHANAEIRVWGTAWSSGSLDLAARVAGVLDGEARNRGNISSAVAYKNFSAHCSELATWARRAFTNDLGNYYTNSGISSQSDCTLALHFDMVPKNQRAWLVTNVLLGGSWGISNYNLHSTQTPAVCSNKLSTGYFCSLAAMRELSREGFTTNAYRLLMDTNYPSWLYPVVNGATTCWEAWNTYLSGPRNASYNDRGYRETFDSFNHLPFGSVAEWVWKVIGGINIDETKPGYENVIIKVEPGGGITNAFALLHSIHGPLMTCWTNNSASNSYALNIIVPANTTASVYLPSTNLSSITESGSPAADALGVRKHYFTNWPNWPGGTAVFEVGSGIYSFSVNNTSF